ncbi:15629_t:CDS:1, partial [Funneliformis geosporum]
KLSEEAIEENTMDGYYNLLKSFRKSYDELVKLKQSEDNANDFLEKMTHVVYDRRWEKEIRNNG